VAILLILLGIHIRFTQQAEAVVNPLASKNNFVGIHILFPTEIAQAKDLINSSGGDWGYVTIPIQITDRDLDKWQAFMDQCVQYHIIPILRIATEPYYANTNVWRRPSWVNINTSLYSSGLGALPPHSSYLFISLKTITYLFFVGQMSESRKFA
jgi:hypothetical protein